MHLIRNQKETFIMRGKCADNQMKAISEEKTEMWFSMKASLTESTRFKKLGWITFPNSLYFVNCTLSKNNQARRGFKIYFHLQEHKEIVVNIRQFYDNLLLILKH